MVTVPSPPGGLGIQNPAYRLTHSFYCSCCSFGDDYAEFASIAQFEPELIRERVRSGLAAVNALRSRQNRHSARQRVFLGENRRRAEDGRGDGL